ncbi:alginate export family protein [bacterium]|nr:alginate export family protein [bacterium]
MKTVKFTALIVVLAMLFGFTAALAGDIEVSGNMRYRSFMDDRDFSDATDASNYSELRTRINMSASNGDNLNFFMQMQDSRTIGNYEMDDMDMHQAYLTYSPCAAATLKLGKFEMNMHNQRLIGSVGWSQFGRTFEGFNYDRSFGSFDATFFGTQISETGIVAADDMFWGANFALDMFDVFGYWNFNEADNSDASMMTLGLYRTHTFGAMDYEFMGASQMGTTAADQDIAAMMVFGEFGYTLANNARVAFLMDYASGQDDSADVTAFNNMYYTGHKFRGAMDYFVYNDENLDPGFGLMDMAFKFNYPVNDAWGLSAAAHMFTYVEVAEGAEDALGNELDFAATYTDGAFKWTNGLSMFMAGDAMGTDLDNSMWFYSQFSASF